MRARRIAVAAGAAALLVPAGAVAAPKVLDREQAEDGTTFTVDTAERLRSGRAVFRLLSDPPAGAPYAVRDILSTARLRRARGDNDIEAGSSLVCSEPSASAAYGTVKKRIRRVVVQFEDGERMRLRTVRAPKRWRWRGRVFAGLRTAPQKVLEVRAFDRRGRRVAIARFTGGEGCD